jgi:type II secretory pathway pseudopilin PulG
MKIRSEQSGFSLIETLLYIAIVAFALGGLLTAVYAVLNGGEEVRAKAVAAQEIVFLSRKIDNALSESNAIVLPAAGNAGDTLIIQTTGVDTIAFSLSAGVAYISRNGASPIPLTDSTVTISSLSFENISASGSAPAAVRTSFFADDNPFDAVRYIR